MDQTGENNDRNHQNYQQDHDVNSLVKQIEKLNIMLKEKDEFIDYSYKHNQALKNMMEGYNSCKNYVKGLEAEVLLFEQEVEESKELISKGKKAHENMALLLIEKDEEIINTNQVLLKITKENDLFKNNEKCLQAKVLQLEKEAHESKQLISKERKDFENKVLLNNKLVFENADRKNANLRKENEMLISENKKQVLQLEEKAEKLRVLGNKVIVNNLVIQKADRDNAKLKQDEAKLISENERLQMENEELKYKLRFVEEKFEDAWR